MCTRLFVIYSLSFPSLSETPHISQIYTSYNSTIIYSQNSLYISTVLSCLTSTIPTSFSDSERFSGIDPSMISPSSGSS